MKNRIIEFTGERQVCVREEALRELHEGEVLVRTTRTLISTGTESIVFTRNFAPGTHFDHWVKYPFFPGYLHCGIIESVGPGVTSWKAGDRVATRANHASHVIVRAEDAWAVPENVSDESAAWMGIGRITQLGVRAAEHRLGDAVVVVGLGLLGQLVVQYAALSGAREIIAVDASQARLDLLKPRIPVHRFARSVSEVLPQVREIQTLRYGMGLNSGFPAQASKQVVGPGDGTESGGLGWMLLAGVADHQGGEAGKFC